VFWIMKPIQQILEHVERMVGRVKMLKYSYLRGLSAILHLMTDSLNFGNIDETHLTNNLEH